VDVCGHIEDKVFLDDVHRLVDESYSGEGFRECAALIGYSSRSGKVRLSKFVCGERYEIPGEVVLSLFRDDMVPMFEKDDLIFGEIHTHAVDEAGESFCFSPGDVAQSIQLGIADGDNDWWICLAHSAGLGDLAVSCGHLSDSALSRKGLDEAIARAKDWYELQLEWRAPDLAPPQAISILREIGRKAFVDFTDRRCATFEWR